MTLSSLHLLSAILTTLPSDTGCLRRLAVHDTRTWLSISFHADAQTLSEGGMQLLSGAVDVPGSEVVVGSFSEREIVRKQALRAATLEYVEDSVENLAGMVEARPTGGFLQAG